MSYSTTPAISLPFTPEDKHELRRALKKVLLDREYAISRYGNMNTWVTTKVTDMSYLFYQLYDDNLAYSFDNINDVISDWDVSNVTTLKGFLKGTEYFNQPLNWNVSNVKNMREMFFCCSNLNNPINFKNLSNVNNMDEMFAHCYNLKQDFSDWDVNGVVDFDVNHMFKQTSMLNMPEYLPKKNYWRPRKSYIMLTEGSQHTIPGKYNTIQENYLFRPEIVRELMSYIY